MVSLIDATQRLGGGLPERTTSGEFRRATEPHARAGLVALRGGAASSTKKEVGGGFVASARRRCPFKGKNARQSPIVEC